MKSTIYGAITGSLFFALSTFTSLGADLGKSDEIDRFSWSGAYAGLKADWRHTSADWDTTENLMPNPFGANMTFPFMVDPSGTLESSGIGAGILVGYNFQFRDHIVVGIEADYNHNHHSDDIGLPGIGVQDSDGRISTAEFEARWDANVRARAGFLVTPKTMIYGAAGLSWMAGNLELTCPADTDVCNPAAGTQSSSEDVTLQGWTVAAGLENVLFDRWLVRLEYAYSNYHGEQIQIFSPSPNTFSGEAGLDVETHKASLGVTYKF